MSGERERILAGIRTALGRGPLEARARAPLEARLATPPRHTRIAIAEDPVERFTAKLQGVAGSLARVGARAEVPEAVSEFLRRHNLGAELAVAPALQGLEWPPQLEVAFGATRGAHATSVTACLAAVAETGSLVLLSGASTPTTLNFLPDNHVVVLDRSQVVRHFEDVWPQLRALPDGMPRTVNLITGPSRTADIEQTIQLGAHGPRRLHVVLVDDP